MCVFLKLALHIYTTSTDGIHRDSLNLKLLMEFTTIKTLKSTTIFTWRFWKIKLNPAPPNARYAKIKVSRCHRKIDLPWETVTRSLSNDPKVPRFINFDILTFPCTLYLDPCHKAAVRFGEVMTKDRTIYLLPLVISCTVALMWLVNIYNWRTLIFIILQYLTIYWSIAHHVYTITN